MRDEFNIHDNWTKRRLPHYNSADTFQAITYRLADSLPQKVLDHIQNEYDSNENPEEYRKSVDYSLDQGYGSCLLQKPENAEIVINAWKHFDKVRYDLICYVIMPNHVHLLIKTYKQWPLNKIIHSWKSFTAHEINKRERRKQNLWQREYWDRFIRTQRHYEKVIDYIHMNPVKAGLVDKECNWAFSSAHKGYN